MADAYDKAVEHFVNFPNEIYPAWGDPIDHPFGYLFAFLTPNRLCVESRKGCPSMVKGGVYEAETFRLTHLVRELYDLPVSTDMSAPLTRQNLEAFAEAQRIADIELHRELPVAPTGYEALVPQ